MKFQTLRNDNRKYFIGAIVFVAVLSTLVLNTSKAKYVSELRIPLVRGTFSYKLGDFNVIYILKKDENGKYDTVDTIPDGYELNKENSYCKRDGEKLAVTMDYNTETKTFTVSPVTDKVTKCYLYFDKGICGEACKTIIANKTISKRTDFSTALESDTTGTIFKDNDNDGTSYYFAGAPTDNWVHFANLYWRIIRINGDGTIRLIYNGPTTVRTGSTTSIGSSPFNEFYDDNAYVGYMYGTPGSTTYKETHKNTNDSTVKKLLDNWYQDNLTNYVKDIDVNAGFCGDRRSTTKFNGIPDGTGGFGTTKTYYHSNHLAVYSKPTLECANNNDLYTLNTSPKGNQALNYPIGLITSSEAMFAGSLLYSSNIDAKNYLYTGYIYATISPGYHYQEISRVHVILANGTLDGGSSVANTLNVRPVINLRANTQFKSGNGTINSPFSVE